MQLLSLEVAWLRPVVELGVHQGQAGRGCGVSSWRWLDSSPLAVVMLALTLVLLTPVWLMAWPVVMLVEGRRND